jgi:hypothetical protein
MTEPIQITQTDTHHFHITIHTSSRVYHFNDQIQGASKWVEIITEVSHHEEIDECVILISSLFVIL